MERILNDNEKIRRAEEIYYRRNHRNVAISRNDYVKPKTYLGSKIILEMLILLILAVLVFAIKNKDYIFTENFLNSVSQYNVNLTEKFGFITKFFEDSENTDSVFVNSNSSEKAENVVDNTAENVNTENIVEKNDSITETPQVVNSQGIVTDVNSLKSSYNFIKPIEGIVSSGFGARESVYQNVRGTHTGIDLAADERYQNKKCDVRGCYSSFE